jgi:hypothetical protein
MPENANGRREGPPSLALPRQAAGDVAARSRRAGEVSRGRAELAGADQCGVARGGGALKLLPGNNSCNSLQRRDEFRKVVFTLTVTYRLTKPHFV